jgi:hypothetical protein
MKHNKVSFSTVDELHAACQRDPNARRFLELAQAFLEEGWEIRDFKGDRFDANKPAGVDGVQSYGVSVDVDPHDGYVSWTATRYLEDDQYEYYDSSANGRDILTAIENETGLPYADAYPLEYTLYEDY